jgi:ketosteroid isomerase-like protein
MMTSINSTAAENRAIVQAFLDKLDRENDVDGLLGLIDENVDVWTPFSPAGQPTRFKGRREVDLRFGNARRPMPAFEFLDVEILATEDPERWVATCASRGVQADGRRYANIYCWLFRIRSGKIVAWTEYYDPQPVMPFLENISMNP